MNSDPEDFQRIRDSEALQKSLLTWLLQEPVPNASFRTGQSSAGENCLDDSGVMPTAEPEVDNLEFDQLDPLESEVPYGFNESENSPYKLGESNNLGEIPAVQDRFCAVLKRRLQTEIQGHPPLFPWETEILDYEPEFSDGISDPLVPDHLWLTQLRNLRLPIPIPEAILAQLLERCQSVVQSSLLQGVKLVRVVEALFPGHILDLNHYANVVLRSESAAYREPREAQQIAFLEAQTDFPNTYETAMPVQQMVLSLLAAHEILGSLTLIVSPSVPRVERQWLTDVGLLTIEAEYRETRNFASIRVQGYLPCGGTLQLIGNQTEATAKRAAKGYLSVELFDSPPNQNYPLEVRFQSGEQRPLVFSIHTATD